MQGWGGCLPFMTVARLKPWSTQAVRAPEIDPDPEMDVLHPPAPIPEGLQVPCKCPVTEARHERDGLTN